MRTHSLTVVLALCSFAQDGKHAAAVTPVALQRAEQLAKHVALAGKAYREQVSFGNHAKLKLDCVTFLLLVVEDLAGKPLRSEAAERLKVNDLSAEQRKNYGSLVDKGDPLVQGVCSALALAGLGERVEAKDARAGDFVQYWRKGKDGKWAAQPSGHAAIVQSRTGDDITIYGCHEKGLLSEQGKPDKDKRGGIGTGDTLDLKDPGYQFFFARWTAATAATTGTKPSK